MSDPDRSGPFHCHGPMLALTLPEIATEDCLAICEQCGVVRVLLATADPRRAAVEQAIPWVIDAYLVGARGDVQ